MKEGFDKIQAAFGRWTKGEERFWGFLNCASALERKAARLGDGPEAQALSEAAQEIRAYLGDKNLL